MVEEKGGWFVVNVREGRWVGHEAFGKRVLFEKDKPFPQTGVNIALLEPRRSSRRPIREWLTGTSVRARKLILRSGLSNPCNLSRSRVRGRPHSSFCGRWFRQSA
jgi:hypothetical protein